MSETKRTLIEEGTELKGTLTSTCPIVVMGRVDGEMTGPSVEVTESGTLCGKAKVTELRSRGELAGEFDAQVVELSGRVRDKTLIRAQSMEVSLKRSDGRIEVVFGECELAIGDAPDKAKAIAGAHSNGRGKAAAGASEAVASSDGVPDAPVTGDAKNGSRRHKKLEDAERQADG
ncbi:MAG TPA: polymer-forming cytoskeletal protein [Polyangia bacterium]